MGATTTNSCPKNSTKDATRDPQHCAPPRHRGRCPQNLWQGEAQLCRPPRGMNYVPPDGFFGGGTGIRGGVPVGFSRSPRVGSGVLSGSKEAIRKLTLCFLGWGWGQVFFKNTEVDLVNVPSTAGDMGILADHVPIIAQLRPGVVEVVQDSKSKKIFGTYFFLRFS